MDQILGTVGWNEEEKDNLRAGLAALSSLMDVLYGLRTEVHLLQNALRMPLVAHPTLASVQKHNQDVLESSAVRMEDIAEMGNASRSALHHFGGGSKATP